MSDNVIKVNGYTEFEPLGTPPPVAPPGKARQYLDSGSNTIKMSANGAPYADLGSGGGGGSFDINNIDKMLWFKADTDTYTDNTFATPATTDGTSVGGWKDKSGHDQDASTTGTKPVLKTNIVNGLPVLRFSSAELDTKTSNFQFPKDEVNFFFVCSRPWQTNGAFHALLGQGAGGAFSLYLATNNTGDWLTKWLVYGATSTADAAPRAVAYTSLTNNTFHVFGIKLGAVSDWRVDGVSVATIKRIGQLNGPVGFLRIGQDGSNSFFDGDLAELIVVPGNLDRTTFNNIEKYLGTKYNISVA